MKTPLWKPRDVKDTNISKFFDFINEKHNMKFQTYEELHKWSVDGKSSWDFWRLAYNWLELAPRGIEDSGRVVDSKVTGNLLPPPRFFPDSMFNIAELILRGTKDEDIAIHFVREGVKGIAKVTWREIREQVTAIRDAMLNFGIKTGDIIAAVISNSVYAVCLCLATLSIGAVWCSSSPDLGPEAIVDRYAQVDPKLIFADDGYIYAGKLIQLQNRISQWSETIAKLAPSLQGVVIIPYCKLAMPMSKIRFGLSYDNFLQHARNRDPQLDFHLLPFSHPAFIVFSSGTTGKPKCIVHSAGGVALKVRIDSVLQHDIRKSDIVFQYTTTSWVMWLLNFLNLGVCRSMLLYDGSPFHPTPTILLQLAQDVGVSVFGTSPRYLSDLRNRGILPQKQFDLGNLRIVTSTGAVLSTELYEWFYGGAFPSQIHLISMSGGTDIAGSFVGGTPLLPVYPGEIQAKVLGMAVEIFDPTQRGPVSVEASGGVGELVCTRPFPSQPLRFHGQGGANKYESSYFAQYGPKVWCQGDLIRRFADTGGLAILGRSDGVLNPSGVRFGSAEIYAVTETFVDIKDSLCVGQRREWDVDERVLLFVMMKDGVKFTADLEQRLKDSIRKMYTSRHVPKYIFEVADIPYTVNGKKCEINVKHIVCCRDMAVSGTVANPAALELYKRFQNLPSGSESKL
ncbi:acetoacetyl-synthase [Aaosphaeria arxii CBS 175.79]|uniref:Acetoacetyl-synthase n=1 Tax=Aaosphaeria arxii CBS 175.79 TaxID=1450172 RepID=A0A6A5Y4W3_9PLEO|nr:acetoacetyl-synthase [Aaosphaeria arxii CBS 175.79]KAF2020077.1 acetoacetyl-synthase [Aaosphaeria arxii CBS 175.79]